MDSAQREGAPGDIASVGIGKVVGFGALLAISCLFSYWIITNILARGSFASRDDDLVGGMWAVIATVFVFRQSLRQSAQAALSRTVATLLAFALCFVYLLIFPFSAFGMAVLIWICTVILYLIGRSEDIVTAAITIAVVLVVAAVSSGPAWLQPVLRLVDTAVGIAVGFLASRLCFVFGHSPATHLNAN
jgi:hypothetical protein